MVMVMYGNVWYGNDGNGNGGMGMVMMVMVW